MGWNDNSVNGILTISCGPESIFEIRHFWQREMGFFILGLKIVESLKIMPKAFWPKDTFGMDASEKNVQFG